MQHILLIQCQPQPLCAAEDSTQTAVQLGEDCLSTWPRSGSYEFRSPVVCGLSRVRHLQGGAANRGRLLFGYFIIGDSRKSNQLPVCHRQRAVPSLFRLCSIRPATPRLLQLLHGFLGGDCRCVWRFQVAQRCVSARRIRLSGYNWARLPRGR